MDSLKHTRLDVKGIAAFLAIAFGLAWLLDLPLLLKGQGLLGVLGTPLSIFITLRNFTPTIATFIVTCWISPLPDARRATGVRRGAKGTRWGWYLLFGILGMPFLTYLAAPLTGSLLDGAPLDVVNFSGYRAFLESLPGGSEMVARWGIRTIVAFALVTLPVITILASPLAFGEEWGWRGNLLPQLLPLGQWRSLLLSGVIWGLWHLPFVAASVYPEHSPWVAVILFTTMAVIIGILLGWTRLATGSVFPAVLGHAGFDSGQMLAVGAVFAQAGVMYDSALVGATGLTGWIPFLLVIAFLVLTRRLPVRNPPDLATSAIAEEQLTQHELNLAPAPSGGPQE